MLYKNLHDFLSGAWCVLNTPVLMTNEELQDFVTSAESWIAERHKTYTPPSKLAQGIAAAKAELILRGNAKPAQTTGI